MDREQIQSELEKIWQEYFAKVRALAAQAKVDHVDPYCRENDMHFLAGNADWHVLPNNVPSHEAISSDSSFKFDEPKDEDQANLIELLELEVNGFGGETLGCLMFDL